MSFLVTLFLFYSTKSCQVLIQINN